MSDPNNQRRQYTAELHFIFPPDISSERVETQNKRLLQLAQDLAHLVGTSLSHKLSFVEASEVSTKPIALSTGLFAPEIQKSLSMPVQEFVHAAHNVKANSAFRTRLGNAFLDRGLMTVKDIVATGAEAFKGPSLGPRSLGFTRESLENICQAVPLETSPSPEYTAQFCRSLDEVPINNQFPGVARLPRRISIANALQMFSLEVATTAEQCVRSPEGFRTQIANFATNFTEAQHKLA